MIPSKSRVKPERSGGTPQDGKRKETHIPDLETFLQKRDYAGACALLQFKRHANRNDIKTMEWLAYCHFHYGEHDKVSWMHANVLYSRKWKQCIHPCTRVCACTHQTSNANTNNSTRSATCKMQALNLYKDLMQFEDFDSMVHIYAAACYYYMGLYKEAEEEAEQVPPF
eukprot:1161843-Pelagomonas_calceolata.AAC.14